MGKLEDYEKLEELIHNKFLKARRLKEERFKKDNQNNTSNFNFYYSNDYSKFLGEELAFNEVLDEIDKIIIKHKYNKRIYVIEIVDKNDNHLGYFSGSIQKSIIDSNNNTHHVEYIILNELEEYKNISTTKRFVITYKKIETAKKRIEKLKFMLECSHDICSIDGNTIINKESISFKIKELNQEEYRKYQESKLK